jgi:hypothetical protein
MKVKHNLRLIDRNMISKYHSCIIFCVYIKQDNLYEISNLVSIAPQLIVDIIKTKCNDKSVLPICEEIHSLG